MRLKNCSKRVRGWIAALLKAFRLQSYWCALLVVLASSAAHAEEGKNLSNEAFDLFEKACFDNNAVLTQVSDLALSENWEVYDQADLLSRDAIQVRSGQKSRLVSTERSSAWSTKVSGNLIIVAATEPKRLERAKCEIITVVDPTQSSLDKEQVGERILALGGERNFRESERQSPVSFPNWTSNTYLSRSTVPSAAGRREPAAAISYVIETQENRVLHTITLYGERMQ